MFVAVQFEAWGSSPAQGLTLANESNSRSTTVLTAMHGLHVRWAGIVRAAWWWDEFPRAAPRFERSNVRKRPRQYWHSWEFVGLSAAFLPHELVGRFEMGGTVNELKWPCTARRRPDGKNRLNSNSFAQLTMWLFIISRRLRSGMLFAYGIFSSRPGWQTPFKSGSIIMWRS